MHVLSVAPVALMGGGVSVGADRLFIVNVQHVQIAPNREMVCIITHSYIQTNA